MTLDVEIDRRDDFLEVRNQDPFPTCLSYATSAVHSVVKEIDNHLSAESLHYFASGADITRPVGIDQIQHALLKKGQPENRHCQTVIEQDPHSWSPPQNVPFYQSRSRRRDPSIQMIREAILDSYIPVLGISLTEEFFYPEEPWIISRGQPQDPHAVVAVGLGSYNGETAVLIRNSWGDDWANSGHAWLDKSFLESHLKDVLLLVKGDNQ